MTIREYLRRKALWLFAIGMAVFVGVGMMYQTSKTRLVQRVPSIVLMAGVAYAIAFIVLMRRTGCPRCDKPLGAAAMDYGSRQSAAHCPHCGARFDEQMPDRR
jgi:ABC-type spermidine/putrescine transport system permease subunit II